MTEFEKAHAEYAAQMNAKTRDLIEMLIVADDDHKEAQREALRAGLRVQTAMKEARFDHCYQGYFHFEWDDRHFEIQIENYQIVGLVELETEGLFVSASDVEEVETLNQKSAQK